VLSRLDLDKSGSLEVSELASAVEAFHQLRKNTRRMRNVIIGLFVLLGLLILALFGVSYAAAILARQIVTSSSATPALTNNAGSTVRTANARMNRNVTIQQVGSARLLYTHEYNDGDLHHRRVMSTQVDSYGRTLQVTAPVDTSLVPPPLAKQLTLKAEIAIEVCAFVAENNLDISMMFDPYQEGVGFVTATFKPETMNGCNDLSNPFGFNSDFEVTFKTGLDPTYWHIDCPGPILPGGVCTVSRVFLIQLPPDLDAANNRDQTIPPPDQAPLPDNTVPGSGRRLATVGSWPASTAVKSVDLSKCPSVTGVGIPTTSTLTPFTQAFGNGILNQSINSLPTSLTVDISPQVTQACTSSIFCMIGSSTSLGVIFQSTFWSNSTALASAMAQSFTQSMSLTNLVNFWNSFKGSRSTKCTTTYKQAVCGMNKLPVFTGNGLFTCAAFNVQNITAGAQEIMQKCANSCQMLQWYFFWWKNYRVGSYNSTSSTRFPYTNSNVPAWFDGANLKYSQDWCGAADAVPCDSINDPIYCGAGTISGSSSSATGSSSAPSGSGSSPNAPPGSTSTNTHTLVSGAVNTIVTNGDSYATHPKCWGGSKIPLCQSANIVVDSAC
jgi:hypothetical protein